MSNKIKSDLVCESVISSATVMGSCYKNAVDSDLKITPQTTHYIDSHASCEFYQSIHIWLLSDLEHSNITAMCTV